MSSTDFEGDEANTTIYPNPVKTTLQINTDKDVANWEIHNQLGEMVKTGEGNSISVEELTNGVYFLKTGGEVYKFMKQ